jgi:hypothetical protein
MNCKAQARKWFALRVWVDLARTQIKCKPNASQMQTKRKPFRKDKWDIDLSHTQIKWV